MQSKKHNQSLDLNVITQDTCHKSKPLPPTLPPPPAWKHKAATQPVSSSSNSLGWLGWLHRCNAFLGNDEKLLQQVEFTKLWSVFIQLNEIEKKKKKFFREKKANTNKFPAPSKSSSNISLYSTQLQAIYNSTDLKPAGIYPRCWEEHGILGTSSQPE